MATESVLLLCTESLKRVQTFDAQTLSREDDLGKQMSFVDAVKHAEAIIALYKRIPLSAIPDFSDTHLTVIQTEPSQINGHTTPLKFGDAGAQIRLA